jgi:hypothetical protein
MFDVGFLIAENQKALVISAVKDRQKVRDGEDTIASTRDARAPQTLLL